MPGWSRSADEMTNMGAICWASPTEPSLGAIHGKEENLAPAGHLASNARAGLGIEPRTPQIANPQNEPKRVRTGQVCETKCNTSDHVVTLIHQSRATRGQRGVLELQPWTGAEREMAWSLGAEPLRESDKLSRASPPPRVARVRYLSRLGFVSAPDGVWHAPSVVSHSPPAGEVVFACAEALRADRVRDTRGPRPPSRTPTSSAERKFPVIRDAGIERMRDRNRAERGVLARHSEHSRPLWLSGSG